MEPSNPTTPAATPPAAPGVANTPPSSDMGLPPQTTSPQVTPASGGSKKKMMLIIIILLLVGILAVGGFYFYQMQMGSKSETPTPQVNTEDLDALQSEADGIKVDDPSADIVEIDNQINLLEATPSSGSASGSTLLNAR